MTDILLSDIVGSVGNVGGGVLGSLPYQTDPNFTSFIPPNISTTPKVLIQTGTGTAGAMPEWSTISKMMVGLGSVDNTSDSSKPVSTAQQTALDAKAPLTGVGASGTWGIAISGNAATASKLASLRNFSLSGIVTAPIVQFDGAGNVTLATVMADGALSIAKTTGLQTALDSKLDAAGNAVTATKLATPRGFSLTGVIGSNAINYDGTGNVQLTTTVADGALSVAKTAGLQVALDAKSNVFNAALTGVPTAPTAAIATNTTQLATTAFAVAQVAADAPTKAGSGATGTWGINITGNAANATSAASAATAIKLTTPRAISLTGPVTASGVNFDGTGNIAITTAIADAALTIAKTSGLQTALNGKIDDTEVDVFENINTIVRRTVSGDINARLLRSTYQNEATMAGAIAYRVNNTTDTYNRYCSNPAAVNNWLGLGTADTVVHGIVNAGRVFSGYDSGIANAISCSDWFRTSGIGGWYNVTYGGGWHMLDTTYVRSYQNKAVCAGDFVITSDRRLKAGIRDFEYRGPLRPVNYYHTESHKHDFGFIAQEVEELYPEAVSSASGDDDTLHLSYPKLTAILSYQVNRLESEVERLRAIIERPSWWKRLYLRWKAAKGF